MITAAPVAAQKASTTVQQIWFSYHNQIRLSNKLGVWNDGQLRTRNNFTRDFSIYILRTGLMYYVNEDLRITAGYSYAHSFAATTKELPQLERRPWQQVLWQNRHPQLRVIQSVRLEERFRRKMISSTQRGEGYDFNYRLRYNVGLNFTFSKKPFEANTFSYTTSNDVHVNFGKAAVSGFDQNRIFLAAQYHTDNQDFLQLGYLYIYQQTGASKYRYTHALRLTYMHILDLRKNRQNNLHPGGSVIDAD